MNPRKLAEKELKNNGYVLKRNGKKHDIYYHPVFQTIVPLKRHDFDENDFRYIRKEIDQQKKGKG